MLSTADLKGGSNNAVPGAGKPGSVGSGKEASCFFWGLRTKSRIYVKEEVSKMAKKAKITRGKHTGKHASGGSAKGILHLRAGAKGRGRVLSSVEYWPWSPRSCEAADHHLYAVAEKLEYEIVPSPEE